MKLCRFGEGRLGVVEGTTVRDVTPALDILPSHRYPLPTCDLLVAQLGPLCERVRSLAGRAPALPLAGLRLLSPVANPGKIIGAPLNYQKHLEEVRGDPQLHHDNQIAAIHRGGLFLKATSALVGAGEGVVLARPDRRNDHEVELAVVIGRRVHGVPRDETLGCVAGYCIGLDMTVRGPEERCLRKSPDTYAVLGPWLVTADELPDPGNLELSLAVNGEVRQRSSTRHMVLGVPELIEFASAFCTLHPGDVIMTGTPEGVGPIEPGDTLLASVEGIGTMEVAVRAA